MTTLKMSTIIKFMNIDSKNKTILVLSDVHHDIAKLEYILKKEKYDVIVNLGDWFDNFYHDSIYDAEKTCRFIKQWIFKDNFITLWGNHDIQYFYENEYAICSGYTKDKDVAINDIFSNLVYPIRNKFKWHIWIDDFLCSHAGIHPYHFPPLLSNISKESINEWLDNEAKQAEIKLINGGDHWFYRAGRGRGGKMKFGGITWLDFKTEFEPIDGLKQIVGHSFHKNIINHQSEGILDFTESNNLDIDCNLNQYLLFNNGKFIIKNYTDL